MKKPNKQYNSYVVYSGIAIQMAVIITAGVFGGYKLDQWIRTGFPLFTIILALASVSIAIFIAIRELLKKK
jgi:predicted ABC-type exoprotein transport system permease subunit